MIGPGDPRHGWVAGYNAGCREVCCRSAHTLYMNLHRLEGRPRLVDSVGTVRRLQALQALGWSQMELSRRLGHSDSYVSQLVRSPAVRRHTARAVAAVYDRLSMTVPSGGRAARIRREATARGWAPPLAWHNIDDPDEEPQLGGPPVDYDEAVVLRRLDGERVRRPTHAEACEVFRRLRARGLSTFEIEHTHGLKAERYSGLEAAS